MAVVNVTNEFIKLPGLFNDPDCLQLKEVVKNDSSATTVLKVFLTPDGKLNILMLVTRHPVDENWRVYTDISVGKVDAFISLFSLMSPTYIWELTNGLSHSDILATILVNAKIRSPIANRPPLTLGDDIAPVVIHRRKDDSPDPSLLTIVYGSESFSAAMIKYHDARKNLRDGVEPKSGTHILFAKEMAFLHTSMDAIPFDQMQVLDRAAFIPICKVSHRLGRGVDIFECVYTINIAASGEVCIHTVVDINDETHEHFSEALPALQMTTFIVKLSAIFELFKSNDVGLINYLRSILKSPNLIDAVNTFSLKSIFDVRDICEVLITHTFDILVCVNGETKRVTFPLDQPAVITANFVTLYQDITTSQS